MTSAFNLSQLANNVNSSGQISSAGLQAGVAVANLGSPTANGVMIGNGSSNPTTVAPGSSGNVLTSNGTTWSSQPNTARSGGTTTSSSVDITLTSSSKQTQLVTMTAANKYVILPDATTLSKGEGVFEITASSTSYVFAIKNGAGDIVYGPVFAGMSVQLSLVDNSTSAGVWNVSSKAVTAKGGYSPISVSSVAATPGFVGNNYGQIIRVCGLSATSALVVYFSSNIYTLAAVVATVSGSTISFGTPVTLTANAISNAASISAASLSSTLAVVCYTDYTLNGNAGGVGAKALSISGTTITAGTVVAASGGGTVYMQVLAATSTTAIVTTVNDNSTNIICATRMLSVSGTTITLGTATTLATVASGPNLFAKSVKTSSNSYVSLYSDSISTMKLQAFTFSGTTLTAGTAVAVGLGDGIVSSNGTNAEGWGYYASTDSCYSPATNTAIFFNRANTSLTVTTSGTTIGSYTGNQVFDPTVGYNAGGVLVPFGSSGQALCFTGSSSNALSNVASDVLLINANSAGVQGVVRPFPVNTLRTQGVGFLDTQTALVAGVITSGTNTYLAAQLLKVV